MWQYSKTATALSIQQKLPLTSYRNSNDFTQFIYERSVFRKVSMTSQFPIRNIYPAARLFNLNSPLTKDWNSARNSLYFRLMKYNFPSILAFIKCVHCQTHVRTSIRINFASLRLYVYVFIAQSFPVSDAKTLVCDISSVSYSWRRNHHNHFFSASQLPIV